VGILSESRDSGHNPGLDHKAKLAIISAKHERSSEESIEGVPDSRIGVKMGDL
jgi:hypothetical protein